MFLPYKGNCCYRVLSDLGEGQRDNYSPFNVPSHVREWKEEGEKVQKVTAQGPRLLKEKKGRDLTKMLHIHSTLTPY